MIDKYTVLNEVISYYIESGDFNGLPIIKMNEHKRSLICHLIDEGLLEVISDDDVSNPHAKILPITIDKEIQKSRVVMKSKHSVAYPSQTALLSINKDNKRPYTSLLQSGIERCKIIFFYPKVLDTYTQDPRYWIYDMGYRGTICIKDEYVDQNEEECDYIKDFGMAYIGAKPLQRAIGVFVYDLSKLSERPQLFWKSFEVKNQEECKIAKGFYQDLILGEWVDRVWIFHALIEEMNIINEQCKAIGLPPLFMHTYSTDNFKMPEGFRTILMPTEKNYYDFIAVLEKLFVQNLNYETFQSKALSVRVVVRKDEHGKLKGSIQMLDEWLRKNLRNSDEGICLIIDTLKKIRKLRQIPAHEIIQDKYDIEIYQKQIDLVEEIQFAVFGIHSLLMKHPMAKSVPIPTYLLDGKDISIY